jgi:hypothetical protein
MKQMLVTYTTMPERTEENTRLVRGVFAELHARAPQGLHYMVLRRDDGTFLHLVRQEEGAPALSQFEAFRTFQQAASERWRDRPVVTDVKVVGFYGAALLAD